MINIQPEQMQALTQTLVDQFKKDMAKRLKAKFPGKNAGKDDASLMQEVEQGLSDAESFGIKSQRDQARFLELRQQLGDDFLDNPRTNWSRQILENRRRPARKRLRAVFAQAFFKLIVKKLVP